MREIKFRVWDKKENEYMGYEDKTLDLYHCMAYNMFMFDNDNYDIASRNIIIEQFTGLTDKNGVEIYEGDKVQDDEMTWIVEYRVSTLSYDLRQIGKDTYDCPLSYIGNLDLLEVIGNIHE